MEVWGIKDHDECSGLLERLSPPPEGWVGVNVDAALLPADRRMGFGVVIHDHHGGFLLCCTEDAEGLPAPELAKALAIQKALLIMKEHDFKKVELVSDRLHRSSASLPILGIALELEF
jgi:hypothetical protein